MSLGLSQHSNERNGTLDGSCGGVLFAEMRRGKKGGRHWGHLLQDFEDFVADFVGYFQNYFQDFFEEDCFDHFGPLLHSLLHPHCGYRLRDQDVVGALGEILWIGQKENPFHRLTEMLRG